MPTRPPWPFPGIGIRHSETGFLPRNPVSHCVPQEDSFCDAFAGAALISQVVGYFSVSYALGRVPAAVVAATLIAQPVLTALLAISLAGEPLLGGQAVGGLGVLVGIWLVAQSEQTFKDKEEA
jgi:drug/metabolite transporter (DMT)-like permease